MITPLRDRDALDTAGLERLIEHIIAGGVQGLFILGTSGEGPGLSYRLRRELIQSVCRQMRGRVPVLVGITDTSFTEAIGMAKCAADAGAQAVVTADHVDAETGLPKVELRRMLDDGLTELARGEGIEMDDAAWDRLRSELRARRPSR